MNKIILSALISGLVTLAVLGGLSWWRNRIQSVPEPEAGTNLPDLNSDEVPLGYFDLRGKDQVLITFEGYDVQPRRIFISSGTELIWKNMDRVSHQVKGELINSPVLKKDELFTITLTEPGVYDYQDSFNPDTIKGTIVVAEK